MTKLMTTAAGKRLSALLLALVLLLVLFPATEAQAQSTGKTVRVGWYDSTFNSIDQYGRRSGYAYEYQRKIAAYTGWTYEYVEGSWVELLDMLEAGEIDLLSDISYTDERAEHMFFSALPMGSEEYYLFVSPNNTEITRDDYSTLNGKRVGANKNSVQADFFLDWMKQHGVDAQLVELNCSPGEALQMLEQGELDAYITLDANSDPEKTSPICEIGSSNFYFAVNKQRADLHAELDTAMNRIYDENKYFNQQLMEKYLSNSADSLYLSDTELAWLSAHEPIRVGYQDGYMAFCAADETTGELTGALKDYLSYASTCLVNATLEFVPVAFPTAAAAMEALQSGDIDCVFPANLTDYDSEMLGVVMTPPLMSTEMYAVVRAADQQSFVRQSDVIVAVNAGNPNYDMFLVDHYPTWQNAHYQDTPACLQAVADGEADCVIISNYRFNNIEKLCEKLHLTTVSTGVDMDYCFAVRVGDTELYAILAKDIIAVPESTVHTALTYYSTEDAKIGFADLVKENLFLVTAVISAVALVFFILLLRSIHAEKKAREEERMINDLNKQVFVDALTKVRNKRGYDSYIEQLQSRLDQGELPEVAIGVFDCDDLKGINDRYGHDKGNLYLKAACSLICKTFQHSPVFRIGGDEFTAILLNEDYRNREELAKQLAEAEKELDSSTANAWEQAHIASGIAAFDPSTDDSIHDTVRRADKIMYENKRLRKER